MKNNITYKKIIGGAIECFNTYGFLQTKFSHVAQKTGISNQLIGHYFSDFNSLFLATVEIIIQKMNISMLKYIGDDSSSSAEKLERYITFHFKWAKKNHKLFSIWVNFQTQAILIPQCQVLCAQIRKEASDRISTFIFEGIAKGEFNIPDPLQVPQLALHIQSLIIGNCMVFLGEKSLKTKNLDEETFVMSTQWLGFAGKN